MSERVRVHPCVRVGGSGDACVAEVDACVSVRDWGACVGGVDVYERASDLSDNCQRGVRHIE